MLVEIYDGVVINAKSIVSLIPRTSTSRYFRETYK